MRNVTNTSSSTYSVLIDGPTSSVGCVAVNGCAGQYSSIVVNGAGNTYTANGTIAPILRNIGAPANNDYTPPVTTSFLAVSAAGGVLGSFTSLTQPTEGLAPGTRFDALYTPNAITLYVTPSSYQNLSAWNTSLSVNQNQVASALDALRGIAGLRNSPMATADFGLLFAQKPQNSTGRLQLTLGRGRHRRPNGRVLHDEPVPRAHAGPDREWPERRRRRNRKRIRDRLRFE